MSGEVLTDEDKRIWAQLVEALSGFGRAGKAFNAPGVNRVELVRAALKTGVDWHVAVWMFDSMPIADLQELFPVLLDYASSSHGSVESFRKAIRRLPRKWAVEQVARQAPALFAAHGDEAYRRILELCVDLDRDLALRIAREAAAHSDPDTREAGEDFLRYLEVGVRVLDHTGLVVSDFERSRAFYSAALAPLGMKLVADSPASMTGNTDVAGFGAPPSEGESMSPEFWISRGTPSQPPVHVALRAPDRSTVHAFHEAALAAGGRDNGAPGPRPQYGPDYYAAFVLDPDGHNIEAVCHVRARDT